MGLCLVFGVLALYVLCFAVLVLCALASVFCVFWVFGFCVAVCLGFVCTCVCGFQFHVFLFVVMCLCARWFYVPEIYLLVWGFGV